MAERQPYHPPIPEPQRAPHEGGNGTLGLPRTVHESAKPPPESVQSNPPIENAGRDIFDCAIPKTIFPPSFLRRMVRGGSITEEQALEKEQEWRQNLKSWDRQKLEKAIRNREEERDMLARRNNQQSVQDEVYELEALRAELRQREYNI